MMPVVEVTFRERYGAGAQYIRTMTLQEFFDLLLTLPLTTLTSTKVVGECNP